MIDPIAVFEDANVSANYAIPTDSPGSPKMYSIEVVDTDADWVGSIKFAAHARGRVAPGAYIKFLTVKNAKTAEYIDGDTGITAAGLYLIDPTGWDIQVQLVVGAGEVSCFISSNNA